MAKKIGLAGKAMNTITLLKVPKDYYKYRQEDPYKYRALKVTKKAKTSKFSGSYDYDVKDFQTKKEAEKFINTPKAHYKPKKPKSMLKK